jgi:hypothetical protein
MDARRSRIFLDEERALSCAARGPGNFLYSEPDELYRLPCRELLPDDKEPDRSEILPVPGQVYLSEQKGQDSITAFWKYTPTLNGANILTAKWVRVTGKLTLYSDFPS